MKRVAMCVDVLADTRSEIKRRAKTMGVSQGRVIDQAVAITPAISAKINGRPLKRGADGVFRL